MALPPNPNMRTYARVQSGTIVELLTTDQDIAAMFHPGLTWTDVTGVAGVGVGWVVSANGVASAPPPPVLTPTQRLQNLMQALDQYEAMGVMFQPASLGATTLFATDPASMPRVSAAYQLAQAGLWTDGSFFRDAAGNPVAFTSAEMISFAQKAGKYVVDCGNYAAQLAGLIQNGQTPDITAGWPSNA